MNCPECDMAAAEACHVCASDDLHHVLCMGAMPHANALLGPDDDPATAARYPLHLLFCASCSLVQVGEATSPDELFGHTYAYHSSVNVPYVAQCHALVDRLVDELGLGPDDFVGEIGSNDGYLLSRYVERGVRVLGWEPAKNLAAIAADKGVRTIPDFFPAGITPDVLVRGMPAVRVLHANNVLAHVPDLHGVLKGAHDLLAPDGLLLVETPYLGHLIAANQYDTIYHEHLFYWSALAFTRAARRAGLAVVDAERIPSHCGSVRLTVMRQGAGQPTERLRLLLAEERRRGMDTPEFYESFARSVHSLQREVREAVLRITASGRTMCGYGAAAKGAVLLNALDLPSGTLAYVVDNTPFKQGLRMPGTDVPIVSPEQAGTWPADVILLLCWNFKDAILDQHQDYLAAGGAFLIPNPTPLLVTSEGESTP